MKKIFFLLLFPCFVFAQKKYSDIISKYMEAQVSVNDFSGAVLAMKADKVIFQKAYGLADREWNVANTLDTKFRIGSITKQFTAVSILQLQEHGKLSIKDKLSKYIPDYPKGDSITIHMLLSHTSGIKNYTELPEFWRGISTMPENRDSIISLFKNKPLDFPPGTNWNYSNSGYFLLGFIIEKASGEKYSDYIYNHVLKPAGMNNSGVDKLDSILYHRARGYSKDSITYRNTSYISMESPFSAGSIYSTVQDLYKWDRALYQTSVISNSSKKQMFTPYKNHYGYGVNIDTFLNHLSFEHGGYINGFLCKIARFPNDDICIISLSNDESNSLAICDCIAAILFDKPVEAPYIHKEVFVDSVTLRRYVGKYEDSNKMQLNLYQKSGKLYRGAQGELDVELKPESETKFFYNDGTDRQIEFEMNKKDKIEKIWTVNEGLKTEWHQL